MKKFALFMTLVLFPAIIIAQDADVLTNAAVIRMVEASLSDEIIIDEIKSAQVKFDLNEDALKMLKQKNVSEPVIQAMKDAAESHVKIVETNPAKNETVKDTDSLKKDTSVLNLNTAAPDTVKISVENVPVDTLANASSSKNDVSVVELKASVNENNAIEASPSSVTGKGNAKSYGTDMLSYVKPMKGLITFHENCFTEISGIVDKWNSRILDSLSKADMIKGKMAEIEKELYGKKTADSRKYSGDITTLKEQLSYYRNQLKILKLHMIADGEILSKEIKAEGDNLINSTGAKYDEVIKSVKGYKCDISGGDAPDLVASKELPVLSDVVDKVFPLTEISYFNKDQIEVIRKLSEEWDIRVNDIFQKDARTKDELQKSKSELAKYINEPKKYKYEISGLKKKCGSLEKTRKKYVSDMKKDSKELSVALDNISTELKFTLKERFKDITDNIGYLYQERFNL